jgi:hypothetical protein
MTDASAWSLAADVLVGELFERGRIERPPVDALALAGRLGIPVALDGRQRERGRHKRLSGQASIFLRPEPRVERLQWAAAHELGEVVAADVFRLVGASADDVPPTMREQVANVVASRLLLPAKWFLPDARRLHGDLPALKQRYATASHELIAYRLLDLDRPAIVTVFDQGRMTRRRTNQPPGPPRLLPVEECCWNDVRSAGRACSTRGSGVTVRGWPVYENGWKREILHTTADEEWE